MATRPARSNAGADRCGGWYGVLNGDRGRLGMYLPPLLEELGLVDLTHEARNNRVRAL